MIYLDLSDTQGALLREQLGSHIRELESELAHTDNREFREALARDVDELQRIIQRLEELVDNAREPRESLSS